MVQLELAGPLAVAEEQFGHSRQPFDQWFAERARELHGVDLRHGVTRYRAELLGRWPEQAPPAAGGDAPAPARRRGRGRKQSE